MIAKTPDERMEDITKALREVCMKPRDDSWHQKQYVEQGIGELDQVVDKMCQLDWLHKCKLNEYQHEIKIMVEQIARQRGGSKKPQYYKGIYMDAATDVQALPKFQLKVNRGLSWMDEFKQPTTVQPVATA